MYGVQTSDKYKVPLFTHDVAMNLPLPTFSFTIPSLYDRSHLECRIYFPRELNRLEHAFRWHRKGGIVAHPYAPLGGCYNDPIVNFVGSELLQAGHLVGTFNFRGAGNSKGRTSWTARPELADYVSFYCFVLYLLHILGVVDAPEKNLLSEEDGASSSRFKSEPEIATAGIDIVLGGYSYGSLIASHLPTVDVITSLFRDIPRGTALFEICKTAKKVVACWKKQLQNRTESRTLHISGKHDEHDDGNASTISGTARISEMTVPSISYLLVSPLLPPISQFLTVFSTLSLSIGAETTAQGKHIPCPKPTDQFCANRTLVIYGSQDDFTSARKLRSWSDELARAPRSKFQYREVDRASHFWRERGVEAQARNALRSWLSDA